jgi:EAL domain-containing protein (putative c-di-GMP-specific phosphodiesterase class I)
LLGYSAVALHQAKMRGRGSLEFYNAQMNSSALERLSLEHELRTALDLHQFELYYQPQLLLKTGEMIGVEALIRWHHPSRGFVSPAIFIPIAEESGLIVEIGKWVLDTACAQLHAWNRAGLPQLRMSINVSAQQFGEPRLIEDVKHALARNGLSAESLKVEITETLLMQDVTSSISVMRELVGLGIQISIDDFGTGYSSLSYLKRFPIAALKADQSFVRALSDQVEDAVIVRAIVAMGHSLNLNVIAEGVETAEQLKFLREIGCDEVQGYYYSRPLPADKLAAFLRQPIQIT